MPICFGEFWAWSVLQGASESYYVYKVLKKSLRAKVWDRARLV